MSLALARGYFTLTPTGKPAGGEWIRVYSAESLCCSPETITMSLIGYIPIQSKKFKTNKKKGQ